MSGAVIYTRVSTDEQAKTGYSLSDQEDRLRKFCASRGWDVIGHFQDDYSAKTFERPAFKEMIRFINLNKKIVSHLLFVRWDRFSRNATSSYEMLGKLRKIGVSPNATEQWLELDIPENKLMLAFYLAAPEVDNDRRSLSVIAGMRRANKEGRWVNKPPIGYIMVKENGRSIMIQNEAAEKVKIAFEEVASGLYSGEEAYIRFLKRGARINKSNFYRMLRNILYTGKIPIPCYKNEPAEVVPALHNPIVSVKLFEDVQLQLDQRCWTREKTTPSNKTPFLHLRGALVCENCNKPFTGSGSRSRTGKIHYYYHCQKGCKTRYRAQYVNESFAKWLKALEVPTEVLNLAYKVLKIVFSKSLQERQNEIRIVDTKIKSLESRKSQAEDMLFSKSIDIATYKNANERYSNELAELRVRKAHLAFFQQDIEETIVYNLSLIADLSKYYHEVDFPIKTKLISSIFPEKILFDGEKYRTHKINKLFELISMKNSKLQNEKRESLLEDLQTFPLSSP